jgi:hypothetical protein
MFPNYSKMEQPIGKTRKRWELTICPKIVIYGAWALGNMTALALTSLHSGFNSCKRT